ncbi:helix-turn-helix domain-containing protein [Paenibacillus endoradicis]|uniref:helix-turn-helix domain-containing protein n=1 Tax=Paenibacillus endoradicis TaxID=2972487 RepID=UPI002159871C|nr:helix-turn-helix domain-containing protein [Paenibacillus endoradicis]MCR8657729.1 helix-turn-helix domain-containing protein [Paenibacillus endoradicis]
MYKAVVVDDERYDLEGLRQLIPWEKLNIEVVCWENRPLVALQYIEEHSIDILITDIKMPVLSGLELAKRAQDLNPQLKKCFISGYQDFQFAKQALDLKADGYVLKPVDDNELIAVIENIVNELTEERNQQEIMAETLVWRRQDSVSQLLQGKTSRLWTESLAEQLGYHYKCNGMTVVIVEIDRGIVPTGESERSLKLLTEQCMIFLEELFHQYGYTLWCTLSSHRLGLIVPYSNNLVLELTKIVELTATKQKVTITTGFGDLVSDDFTLKQAFEQAQDCINYKMFLGKNRVIAPSMLMPRYDQQTEDIQPILDRMFHATIKYQLVNIYDCIDELFAVVQYVDHPQKVYYFATHIALKLQNDLAQMNESFQSLLGWGSNNLEMIAQFETIYDIQKWLRSTLFEISETLYMRKQKRNYRLFEEIIEYIEQRLSGEITLREVANYFAYSPNHLGHMFKETVGSTFNEYVLMRRMEVAKELLRNHKLKVYEVADQIGYKSLTHFSRTFREAIGMTPGEFRKKSG